jgi:acyl-CoA reductase-like NAD-dependent aldehyde dehydrogenase
MDNDWTASNKTRQVINPFNEELIAVVAESSRKDLDDAPGTAREAFDGSPGCQSTPQQRGCVSFAMSDLASKHAAMRAGTDLEAATDGALFPIFINQGEVCSAGSRMLIQHEVFKQSAGRMKSGHGRELNLHRVEEVLETKQVPINLSERPIGWY